jgi:uncharacterized membrane protein YebE (DUF533 family)
MIDATRILDLLVGGGQGANNPFGDAPHQVPARTDNPQQPQTQQGGAPDLMARARDMLGGVTGNLPGGFGGGMAGGVAAGAITSLLLGSKGGRDFAGEALKLGAAAALGGLAYRAYANYRAGQPIGHRGSATSGASTASASVPSVTPTPLPAATPANAHALLLVRAMIAAALADGTLDATERQTIIGRLEVAGINADELQFLDAEIARPWSPGQFAAAAPNPEQRAEIYLASALAIDADTDAERTYLRYLAAALSLDDALIAHLEDAVRGARSGASGAPPAPPKALAAG